MLEQEPGTGKDWLIKRGGFQMERLVESRRIEMTSTMLAAEEVAKHLTHLFSAKHSFTLYLPLPVAVPS